MNRFAALVLAAALVVPGAGRAQTQNFSTEVQGLAPQLLAFAGSPANFQSLVNGLALGVPVSLVGTTADGLQQTATFTPSGTRTSVQIAQTLEQARQALITRGIAVPTPEQIGVALLGGALPTPAGTTSVAGILAAAQTGAPASASAGASAPVASNLQVTIRPAATTTLGGVPVPAMTSASPQVSNTSDTPRVRNTSDSPLIRNTSDSPLSHNTSDSPALPGPSSPAAAGAAAPGSAAPVANQPSPAAQLQGRR